MSNKFRIWWRHQHKKKSKQDSQLGCTLLPFKRIDKIMSLDNCKSRSEFLEKAALFYAGYVAGKDAASFLPTALVSALRATVTESEKHICRMLFKLTVELDMMMNVLAAGTVTFELIHCTIFVINAFVRLVAPMGRSISKML